jgi:hypothetical protein
MCAQVYAEGQQFPFFVMSCADAASILVSFKHLLSDLALVVGDFREVLTRLDRPPGVPVVAVLSPRDLVQLPFSVPVGKLNLFRFCIDGIHKRTTEMDIATAFLAEYSAAVRQVCFVTAFPELCNFRVFKNLVSCGSLESSLYNVDVRMIPLTRPQRPDDRLMFHQAFEGIRHMRNLGERGDILCYLSQIEQCRKLLNLLRSEGNTPDIQVL